MEMMANDNLGYWDIKDIKDKAKIAKTINWDTVMEAMLNFNQESPMMMAVNWDHEIDIGIRRKPFAPHRHYRTNIEKMIHTGCFHPKKAEMYINYARSLRLDRSQLTGISEEEVEGEDDVISTSR